MNTCRAIVAVSVALAAVATTVRAAEITVFRCVDPSGRTLYTDMPCRNARVVELNPGEADPAAVQRLAQAQAELDAGMERYRADEARAAARREALYTRDAMAGPPPDPLPTADAYWPIYGGYIGPIAPRPPHVRPIRPPSQKVWRDEPRVPARMPAPRPRR